MIKVKTTRFGEIEVKEGDVITVPSGLIGFPELKQYVLLDHDDDSPFKWFQSLEDGSIAFVLINPLLFKPEYLVEATEADVAELEVQSEEDLVVSAVVTVPSNPQNMTANLKAPLIFNLKNRRGKQIILNAGDYSTRHNIMDEMKKLSEALAQEQATKEAQEAAQEGDQKKAQK